MMLLNSLVSQAYILRVKHYISHCLGCFPGSAHHYTDSEAINRCFTFYSLISIKYKYYYINQDFIVYGWPFLVDMESFESSLKASTFFVTICWQACWLWLINSSFIITNILLVTSTHIRHINNPFVKLFPIFPLTFSVQLH